MYNLYILFVTMSKVVFESGDMVNLPLYWKGVVIEQFGESVVIQFSNPLFWLKRVPKHLFDYGTDERLTKKKKEYNHSSEQYMEEVQIPALDTDDDR